MTVIRNQFRTRDLTIGLDDDLVTVCGASDLDLIQLVLQLQSEFKVSIPNEDTGQLRTGRLVSQYLERKQKKDRKSHAL